MALSFRLSSGDSHIVEPPDLWTKRIDRKYLDRAPRIVSEAKTDSFICPGALSEKGGIGLIATMPKYTKNSSRGSSDLSAAGKTFRPAVMTRSPGSRRWTPKGSRPNCSTPVLA